MSEDESPTSRFLNYIEDEIRAKGFWRMLWLPGLILSGIVAFGVVLSFEWLVIATLVALILFLGVLLIAMSIDRRQFRALAIQQRQALEIYGKRLTAEINHNRFSVVKWREITQIERNGDAVIERWITLRVSDDAPLEAFWAVQSTHSSQMSSMLQSRVSFIARMNNESGADMPTSVHWDSTNACRAFIHIQEPFDAKSIVTVYAKWTWPRHFSNLTDGGTEPFAWTFRRTCDFIQAEIRIPKLSRFPYLALPQGPADPQFDVTPTATSHVLTFMSSGLNTGDRIVFDLQLKP